MLASENKGDSYKAVLRFSPEDYSKLDYRSFHVCVRYYNGSLRDDELVPFLVIILRLSNWRLERLVMISSLLLTCHMVMVSDSLLYQSNWLSLKKRFFTESSGIEGLG